MSFVKSSKLKILCYFPNKSVKWRTVLLLSSIVLLLITIRLLYDIPVVRESARRTKTKIIFMNKDLCALPASRNDYQKTVVMIVLTGRNNFENRNLIRQTYGSITGGYNVHILAVVFMLRNWDAPGVLETDRQRLQAEIDRFGDIIVGDFVDSYRNLTLKSIMAYEWLTSFCREAQLVVKTDDDVLVNIYQLKKELDSWSPADLSSSKIWCWIHRNESTITDVTSRYYASPVDFPNGTFTVHCSGLGYVTPIAVIDRIIDEVSRSFSGRVCTHEDVFMTGVVRNHINSIQKSFWRKSNPIELVDRKLEWRSVDLHYGKGDDDYFLTNLIKQETNANESENLVEFRRRFNTKIFYLIAHSDDYKRDYLRLWQIIKKCYAN